MLYETSHNVCQKAEARVWNVVFVYIDGRDYALCTCLYTRRQDAEESRPSRSVALSQANGQRCQEAITQDRTQKTQKRWQGKARSIQGSAVRESAAACLSGRVHYSRRGELRNRPLLL